MGQGSERNQPCWCGSGRKFKHCHLNRQSEQPFSPKDIVELRKRFGRRRTCLHPLAGPNDCSAQYAAAHSVSLRYLERIASAKHVYTYEGAITRDVFTSILARPRRIGVRDASTFPGFCARHDNELFRSLDQRDPALDIASSFRLAYRAFSRELYFKQEQLRTIPLQRSVDKGMNPDQQVRLQHDIDDLEKVVQFGLAELEADKVAYDDMLISENYSRFGCYTFLTGETPPVCCAGGAPMVTSLLGGELARPDDVGSHLEHVVLTILPLEPGGFISFGWLEPSSFGTTFLNRARSVPPRELADRLLTFMFANFENVFMAPTWWDGLSEGTRQEVMNISGFAFGLDTQRRIDLMTKPLRGLDSWSVKSGIWAP